MPIRYLWRKLLDAQAKHGDNLKSVHHNNNVNKSVFTVLHWASTRYAMWMGLCPPAIITPVRLIDNSSGSILTPGWSYLHLCLGSSISLRLTSACPTTSLSSACSLIAFIFGLLSTFLTRKFVVVRWDGGWKTMSWFFPQKYLILLWRNLIWRIRLDKYSKALSMWSQKRTWLLKSYCLFTF